MGTFQLSLDSSSEVSPPSAIEEELAKALSTKESELLVLQERTTKLGEEVRILRNALSKVSLSSTAMTELAKDLSTKELELLALQEGVTKLKDEVRILHDTLSFELSRTQKLARAKSENAAAPRTGLSHEGEQPPCMEINLDALAATSAQHEHDDEGAGAGLRRGRLLGKFSRVDENGEAFNDDTGVTEYTMKLFAAAAVDGTDDDAADNVDGLFPILFEEIGSDTCEYFGSIEGMIIILEEDGVFCIHGTLIDSSMPPSGPLLDEKGNTITKLIQDALLYSSSIEGIAMLEDKVFIITGTFTDSSMSPSGPLSDEKGNTITKLIQHPQVPVLVDYAGNTSDSASEKMALWARTIIREYLIVVSEEPEEEQEAATIAKQIVCSNTRAVRRRNRALAAASAQHEHDGVGPHDDEGAVAGLRRGRLPGKFSMVDEDANDHGVTEDDGETVIDLVSSEDESGAGDTDSDTDSDSDTDEEETDTDADEEEPPMKDQGGSGVVGGNNNTAEHTAVVNNNAPCVLISKNAAPRTGLSHEGEQPPASNKTDDGKSAAVVSTEVFAVAGIHKKLSEEKEELYSENPIQYSVNDIVIVKDLEEEGYTIDAKILKTNPDGTYDMLHILSGQKQKSAEWNQIIEHKQYVDLINGTSDHDPLDDIPEFTGGDEGSSKSTRKSRRVTNTCTGSKKPRKRELDNLRDALTKEDSESGGGERLLRRRRRDTTINYTGKKSDVGTKPKKKNKGKKQVGITTEESTKERPVPSATSTKVSASSNAQEITSTKDSCHVERDTTTKTHATAPKDPTGTNQSATTCTAATVVVQSPSRPTTKDSRPAERETTTKTHATAPKDPTGTNQSATTAATVVVQSSSRTTTKDSCPAERKTTTKTHTTANHCAAAAAAATFLVVQSSPRSFKKDSYHTECKTTTKTYVTSPKDVTVTNHSVSSPSVVVATTADDDAEGEIDHSITKDGGALDEAVSDISFEIYIHATSDGAVSDLSFECSDEEESDISLSDATDAKKKTITDVNKWFALLKSPE